jgi:uncharacterized protein YjbI with pentapeptide repeats
MTEKTPKDLEAIKAIISGHQIWLQRRGGRCGDLSFRDLSRLSLPRIKLTGARMTGIVLTGAKLVGADLSQTDLFGADMEGADLTGANLAGADLRGANLHRAILADATLRGADLRAGTLVSGGVDTVGKPTITRLTEAHLERSIMAGANFTGCDLSGADLNDADLTGAELSSAVLVGTDLSGATLEGARFGRTVIDQATLRRTYIPFVMGSDSVVAPTYRAVATAEFMALVAAHEAWVNTQGGQGRRLDCDGLEVSNLDIAGRILSAGRLRNCRFPRFKGQGVSLEMADIAYTDFSGGELADADLRGVTARRTVFAGANLTRAKGTPVDLAGGRTWPANFDGADFTRASLEGAAMTGAVLHGAHFDGATLTGSGISAEVTVPSRPADPQERRRQKRFVRPGLLVRCGTAEFRTRNWSVGGMCLKVPDTAAFRRGDVVHAMVNLADRQDVSAAAEFVVLYVNGARGNVSVRFDRYTDELKALLKLAFMEHQKTTG